MRRRAQSGHVYQLRVSNISLSTRHPAMTLNFVNIAPSPFSLSSRLDIPALISLRLPGLNAAFLCLFSSLQFAVLWSTRGAMNLSRSPARELIRGLTQT